MPFLDIAHLVHHGSLGRRSGRRAANSGGTAVRDVAAISGSVLAAPQAWSARTSLRRSADAVQLTVGADGRAGRRGDSEPRDDFYAEDALGPAAGQQQAIRFGPTFAFWQIDVGDIALSRVRVVCVGPVAQLVAGLRFTT